MRTAASGGFLHPTSASLPLDLDLARLLLTSTRVYRVGGAPPPAGTPNQLVNCGGGNTYRIGDYFPANESFVWAPASSGGQNTAQLEYGQAGWWGAQGGAGGSTEYPLFPTHRYD